MGIAALILGIVTLVFCWLPYIALFTGVAGIVLGAIGSKKNDGKAKTGMVLSIVGLAICLVTWIACIACAASL